MSQFITTYKISLNFLKYLYENQNMQFTNEDNNKYNDFDDSLKIERLTTKENFK